MSNEVTLMIKERDRKMWDRMRNLENSSSESIIKPQHNKIGGKHTYEVVTDIARANDQFDEFDIVMLSYMFKHIPRAGRKIYPGKTALQSKILDLKKTQEYLGAWIDNLETQTIDPVGLDDGRTD